MRRWYLLPLLLALGCAEAPGATSAPVVYGVDGRLEVYEHPSPTLQSAAREAIVMKVRATFLDETDPANVLIDYTRTLGEAKSLCPGERFADQLEPGSCSGTLIDGQHVLTAGHCMDAADDCADFAWLFGFHYVSAGALARLTSDDVYACSSVVALFNDDQVDYAVVRLDRPVVGHTPATVRMDPSALPRGTPVALLGHPNGIPLKIDSGGEVTWSSAGATWFRSTVDAFSGNSGSGTFTHDGMLAGVLGGGATDYVDAGGCQVVNVIDPPPTDDGERLTYVGPAIAALCAVPGVVSPLCACGGAPCVEGLPHDRCDDAEPIEAASQTITDTLIGYAPWASGECGGRGPERVYTFTLAEPARIIATSEGFDTVLYLREATCDGIEIACEDDIAETNRGSRLSAALEPGTYFLFLDAYDADVGSYTLTLDFIYPVDAGSLADAGASDAGASDAGSAVDAGPTIDPPEGCTCRAAGPRRRTTSRRALAVLLGLALLALRRRQS